MAIRDEGISDESRVYFIDSARKMNRQLLALQVPSVNFRGLMDPVSGRSVVGGCVSGRSVVGVCDNYYNFCFLQSPFQISDQTPMETVVEMVRKLGIRQVLISHKG